MGGEKRMFQKVMPEILDTPKGIWGKIQRERKKKTKKTLTLSKCLQEAKVKAQISLLAL